MSYPGNLAFSKTDCYTSYKFPENAGDRRRGQCKTDSVRFRQLSLLLRYENADAGDVKRTAWRFEGSGYDESGYHSEVTRERHERDTIYFCDRGPECVRIRKQCCVSLLWWSR